MWINWNITQVRLNVAGRVRCEAGWALRPQWSEKLHDFDLWFISEGTGRMRMRQGVVQLRPGMCFWMRPGGLYDATQNSQDPMTVSFAHFDLFETTATGARPRLRSFDKPLPPELLVAADANLVDALMRRLASTPLAGIARAPIDEPARALFRGLLMELDASSDTATASSRGTDLHHRQLVQKVALRITERPGEAHHVADLARQAGYSSDHFTRVFKQIIGISPQAYVIRARVDRARQLLLESSLSISQIADVLGYEDLFFFSRQFKSRTGSTPRQYRDQGR